MMVIRIRIIVELLWNYFYFTLTGFVRVGFIFPLPWGISSYKKLGLV